jgi:hypothetical protein
MALILFVLFVFLVLERRQGKRVTSWVPNMEITKYENGDLTFSQHFWVLRLIKTHQPTKKQKMLLDCFFG